MKCSKCGSSNTKRITKKTASTQYYCNDCRKNFRVENKLRGNLFKDIAGAVTHSDEKYLWLIFAFFSALYFFTYINANNYLIVDAFHDDALYYWLGQNIAAGKWLGNYMPLTLAKMPGYAMFLAFSIETGIPYMELFAICHILAVVFLIQKSKYLFGRAKYLIFILGILLLFSPFVATHLRIYRFQLPALCFIVFLASIISVFKPGSKKPHWIFYIIDAIVIIVAWGILWFSREEYLLYFGSLVLTVIAFLFVRKFIASGFWNLHPLFFGLIGVMVFWLYISSMNNKYYGRFIANEKTSAPFTDVIKTFNSIADPEFPENVSGSAASREKINRVAEVVPMFEPMAKNLIIQAMGYRGTYFDTDALEFVNEPENTMTVSHFEWAWIGAASATGYYKDASTLAEFYTKLDKQLTKAIHEGRLLAKDNTLISIGPYSLKENDLGAIIKLLPDNYFKIFKKPKMVAMENQNILCKMSPLVNEAKMEDWKNTLKINYLAENNEQEHQECLDSFSNKFWNLSVKVWAYTAMPLIHLAIILTLIAMIISIIRKQWIFVALITVISSTYIAHYLMLTIVSVISSFNAVNQAYYLPSYGAALITSFLAIGIIFKTAKPDQKYQEIVMKK